MGLEKAEGWQPVSPPNVGNDDEETVHEERTRTRRTTRRRMMRESGELQCGQRAAEREPGAVGSWERVPRAGNHVM